MVDIDGTICYTEGSNYEDSRPMQERIDLPNKLFDEGLRDTLLDSLRRKIR